MTDLSALRATQPENVLTPSDAGYETAASKWGTPAAPDVLVRPETATELGDALRWAVATDTVVGVRSGGHGQWAHEYGGLLVDLSAFDTVEVLANGNVRVGAGAVWGDVADALRPHGLAISAGDTKGVGVGGLTLAAGVGWMLRYVGLAADQLVRAELVTVDGQVVAASADEHPDLFFAIRGGGGNFGVATHLEFRPTPVRNVVFATAPIEAQQLGEVIRSTRDAMRTAPRELDVTVVRLPPFGPAANVPPMIKLLWAGDDEAAARAAFEPILSASGVGVADITVAAYADVLVEAPPLPPGPPPRTTEFAPLFRVLADETVDKAMTALAAHPATVLEVRYLGGALADVPIDATALGWRDAEALVHWAALLPGDASDEELQRVRDLWSGVAADSTGFYGSFTEDGPDILCELYLPNTLARLRETKQKWDPANVLRRNHNIPPAG